MGLHRIESLESLEHAMNGDEQYNQDIDYRNVEDDDQHYEKSNSLSFNVQCRGIIMGILIAFVSLITFGLFIGSIMSGYTKVNDTILAINNLNSFIVEKIVFGFVCCACLHVTTIIYLRELDKKMEKIIINTILETHT